MDYRTPRALAAAAALALALGACSDIPTTAPARMTEADQPVRTVSPSGVTLIPNTVKYRDNGAKPATGRSGSAALEVFALLSKDGRTDVEYRAVPTNAYPGWWGTVTRARITALNADGTTMFTYSDEHVDPTLQRTQLGSLARGQYVEVHANVKDIDPHRTAVVTATERVKLRPDLAVHMAMSSQVLAGQPVPIVASISERNGDVGAYAECRLLVDGVVRDRAENVWIDAGDAVTCAFTHGFSAGEHQVQVEVAQLQRADWDDADNRSAVAAVEAVARPAQFRYQASVYARQTAERTVQRQWFHNSVAQQRGEYIDEYASTRDVEYAYMTGAIDRVLWGEVVLEVSQASGGRVIHSDTWTKQVQEFDVWGEEGYQCTSRWMEFTSFSLCSVDHWGWKGLNFTYFRMVGTVTYHSREYARIWDYATGEDLFYYHYNSTSSYTSGALARLGDDYSFHVRVAVGDMVLTADSRFPLTHWGPSSNVYSDCYETQWPDREGYASGVCTTREFHAAGSSGSDSNNLALSAQ